MTFELGWQHVDHVSNICISLADISASISWQDENGTSTVSVRKYNRKCINEDPTLVWCRGEISQGIDGSDMISLRSNRKGKY